MGYSIRQSGTAEADWVAVSPREAGFKSDLEALLEVPTLTWQTPTVLSPAMPSGKFLCGDFQRGTVLFEREMMNVQIAFQNEDDFVRNLATMRAELRSALAVPLPAALLQGAITVTAVAATANAKK